jgi:outer membrane protein, heavy metal efflux system
MRVRISRVALAVLLWPAGAHAQSSSLTEAEALAKLSESSAVVRAARAGVAVAQAEVVAASRWPNPRFTYNRESVAGVAENMFMVAQPLPIGGRRGLQIDAAESRVEASAERASDRVRRLRADLRLAFLKAVTAQARERELSANRDRLRELADILVKRESAGESAGFDRLRAEREVWDVEATRASAAAERSKAQAILGSFFNDSTAQRFEAVQTKPARAVLPSVDELTTRAEQVRGELIAWQRELEAARSADQAAARLWIPEPEVVAGTKSSSISPGDVGGVFSVHLNVPLFDRGYPERALAQARASQARAEAEALRRGLRAQIAAWHDAVVARREIADRYRDAMSGSADQIERIARISYDAGEQGIFELLDAYRTSASSRLRQVDLDADVREAEIELEFLSGWDVP